MDSQQIERARKAKRMYLLAALFNLIVGAALRLTDGNIALSYLGLGCIIFSLVVTWRFCRSIQIGKLASAVNAALSPFIFIFQLIVLLRMYAKRTGVRLTFLMGDRAPRVPVQS
jgi:hypothetical protein